MASFSARFCACFMLVSICFASASASSVQQRSKRQYVCGGSLRTSYGNWTRCNCGVQLRSVTTVCCEITQLHTGCRIVTSRQERRSCLMRCPSNYRQPVLQSLRPVGSSYQIQCSCPAGYLYDRETGCCPVACRCLPHQMCITRRGTGTQTVAYCEDTCNGYRCPSGQECYLTTLSCRLVSGVQICPRVARCRSSNPCYPLQCLSYQRCRASGNMLYCEDTCDRYPGCRNYEECYLRRVTYCTPGNVNCVYGNGVGCRLRATKPGRCPVIQATHCYSYTSNCYRDDQCLGSSKCCHDGCRYGCAPVYHSDNPCLSISCLSYQVCHRSKGTVYCRDTCNNNGPCRAPMVCRLVDRNCSGQLPCPQVARCEKPPCQANLQTVRISTQGYKYVIHYPGRVVAATCGRFNGSLVIIVATPYCISVTADLRYPNPKPGETIKVYDGNANRHLLWEGSSLRNVNIVSSGQNMTILFMTPDIGASLGIYLLINMQNVCSVLTPTPSPVEILTTNIITTSAATTPVVTTQIVTTSTSRQTRRPTTDAQLDQEDDDDEDESLDTTASGQRCPTPCPTPAVGCALVKESVDDCCGIEKCYLSGQ